MKDFVLFDKALKENGRPEFIFYITTGNHRNEGCPIHPICNGSSKGLTVRHGSFNPSTQNDDPSTGSHFARDLEKIHYRVMTEG